MGRAKSRSRKTSGTIKTKRPTPAQQRGGTRVLDVPIDAGSNYTGRRPKSTKKIGGSRKAVAGTSSRRQRTSGK